MHIDEGSTRRFRVCGRDQATRPTTLPTVCLCLCLTPPVALCALPFAFAVQVGVVFFALHYEETFMTAVYWVVITGLGVGSVEHHTHPTPTLALIVPRRVCVCVCNQLGTSNHF